MANKTRYNKDTPIRAEAWITTHGLIEYGGATLQEYCEYMGFDNTTHYRYMKQFADYTEAIKRGRDAFRDKMLKDAVTGLNELVNGYYVEDSKTEYVADKDGKPVLKHKVVTRRYIPRNTAAVIFALTNLAPEQWKNRQDTETKLNADGISITFAPDAGKEARTKEEE